MKLTSLVPAFLMALASASAGHELQAEAMPDSLNATLAAMDGPESINFTTCRDFQLPHNIFNIGEVILDPNPPQKGRNLHIVLRGNLSEPVEKGAYLKVALKLGILKQTLKFDFCKGVEAGCPAPAGPVEFWTGKNIPKFIPRGTAQVQIRPYTKHKKIMGCVESEIELVKPPK